MSFVVVLEEVAYGPFTTSEEATLWVRKIPPEDPRYEEASRIFPLRKPAPTTVS